MREYGYKGMHLNLTIVLSVLLVCYFLSSAYTLKLKHDVFIANKDSDIARSKEETKRFELLSKINPEDLTTKDLSADGTSNDAAQAIDGMKSFNAAKSRESMARSMECLDCI